MVVSLVNVSRRIFKGAHGEEEIVLATRKRDGVRWRRRRENEGTYSAASPLFRTSIRGSVSPSALTGWSPGSLLPIPPRGPRPRRPRWRRRGRQRRRRLCYWHRGTVSEWLDCSNIFASSSSSLCSRAMCRLTVLFLVNVREQYGHGTLIPWWRCRTWARRFVS